ncbi:MAG: hypothetical protein ACLPPF_18220 [Rhodomicrobium sp.]
MVLRNDFYCFLSGNTISGNKDGN